MLDAPLFMEHPGTGANLGWLGLPSSCMMHGSVGTHELLCMQVRVSSCTTCVCTCNILPCMYHHVDFLIDLNCTRLPQQVEVTIADM